MITIDEREVFEALRAAGHDVYMPHEQCRWVRYDRLVLVGIDWPSHATRPDDPQKYIEREATGIDDLLELLAPYLQAPNPNTEDTVSTIRAMTPEEARDDELRTLRQYKADTERMMEGVPAMQTFEDGSVVFTIPTLANLQTRAFACSVAHGWWEGVDPFDPMIAGAKIALMHSELSEALEELRKPEQSEDALAEELADTIIRIFDFAGARGLDLQGALLAKMDKNDARPHRHGGKKL